MPPPWSGSINEQCVPPTGGDASGLDQPLFNGDSCSDLRVPHQLLECGQGDSRPHHIGSKGVSKAVGIGLQNLAAYAMMAKQGAESGQGHG